MLLSSSLAQSICRPLVLLNRSKKGLLNSRLSPSPEVQKSQFYNDMIAAPVTPLGENDTTSAVIPENASVDAIEAVVEDIPGRVNIVDNVMYRDMPECLKKAAISITWGRLFGAFLADNNLFSAGGTCGTVYGSGNLLSPDLAVWNWNEPHRHQEPGVGFHLMRNGAAPNWVLEFEWHSEINRPRKGIRKVLDGYFNEIGTNQSRVDEAWVMVMHQDVPVHNMPPPPSVFLRLLRRYSYTPFVGIFLFVLLRLLDLATGTQHWTGRTRRRDTPPTDPAVPYIIVYFHQRPQQRYGYFWLNWHEDFVAPAPSLFHRAPVISVNPLLQMLQV